METQIRGVSLDLGKTRTGIACWRDQQLQWVEVASFASTTTLGETLSTFSNWLALWVKENTDWIAYEQRMTGGARLGGRHLELHYGMVGALHLRAWHLGIPILSIPIGTAKKALTGTGRADKDAMLAAARERYPQHDVLEHDVADAIAVGLAALSRIELPK